MPPQIILTGLRALAMACLFVMAFSAPLMAVEKQSPGSRVVMDVPETFEVSKLFSGFILPVAGMSVVITELPASRYDRVAAGLSDAALAKKGFRDIKRSPLKRGDEHTHFTAKQSVRGEDYLKTVLVFRDAKHVAVITVNVPTASLDGGFVGADVTKEILTSAKFAENAAPLIKEFTIATPGPFKEAGRVMGSAVLYTLDGELRPAKAGSSRSMIIVAPSVDRFAVPDLEAFSRKALNRLGGYEDLKITKAADVTIDGMKGSEVSATAVNSRTKEAVDILQVVMARSGGGYFRVLAIVNSRERDKILPAARALITSFAAKK